jgi:hypothetical protein
MAKREMEKPPVRVSKSGVSSVSPADIVRSRAGQAQIQKTIRSGIYKQERSRAVRNGRAEG